MQIRTVHCKFMRAIPPFLIRIASEFSPPVFWRVPESQSRISTSPCLSRRASSPSRSLGVAPCQPSSSISFSLVEGGPSRRGNTAFTLVELLITIAIVGILAALLFPAFSKARGAANRVACVNNLRQMGVLFHAYIADIGEYPDLNQPPSPTGDKSYTWFELLFRQGNPNVKWGSRLAPWSLLTCRSEQFSDAELSKKYNYYRNFPVFVSYGYNSDITPNHSSAYISGARTTTNPVLIGGNAVLLADNYSNPPSISSDPSHQWILKILPTQSVGALGVHSDGMNVLYSDGHVAWRNTPLTATDMHPWGQ